MSPWICERCGRVCFPIDFCACWMQLRNPELRGNLPEFNPLRWVA